MEYKSCLRLVKPAPNQLERITGMKKIVENFVIVKPKAERVHFQTKLKKPENSDDQMYTKIPKETKFDPVAEEKKAVADLIRWYSNC